MVEPAHLARGGGGRGLRTGIPAQRGCYIHVLHVQLHVHVTCHPLMGNPTYQSVLCNSGMHDVILTQRSDHTVIFNHVA